MDINTKFKVSIQSGGYIFTAYALLGAPGAVIQRVHKDDPDAPRWIATILPNAEHKACADLAAHTDMGISIVSVGARDCFCSQSEWKEVVKNGFHWLSGSGIFWMLEGKDHRSFELYCLRNGYIYRLMRLVVDGTSVLDIKIEGCIK